MQSTRAVTAPEVLLPHASQTQTHVLQRWLTVSGAAQDNEQLLSDREKRMQKTYNELFKLQNLLEKTVRSVEVKNNLKSIGSVEATWSKQRKGAGAGTGTGAGAGVTGGRPYYPGSPVRGSCLPCMACSSLTVHRNQCLQCGLPTWPTLHRSSPTRQKKSH